MSLKGSISKSNQIDTIFKQFVTSRISQIPDTRLTSFSNRLHNTSQFNMSKSNDGDSLQVHRKMYVETGIW